jgi:signal transduction histidine kinase
MVQQLLDYSRHQQIQTEAFEITDLVQQSVENLGYEMFLDSTQINIDHHPPRLRIHADPQRLELALINVLRNAVQAAKNAVHIGWQSEHNNLVIRIEDDGPGLDDPQQSDKLLSPFYTTKSQGEGTGLGLTIAAHIIRDHQGKLTLANREEGGCQVTITLPLQENSHDKS